MNFKTGVVLGVLCLAVVSCSGEDKGDEEVSLSTAKPAFAPPAVRPVSVGGNVGVAGGSCLLLMEKYCVSCHSEARICQKIGKKSEARWMRTIKRMVKRGSTLPAADKSTLVDCLVSEDADIRAACQ